MVGIFRTKRPLPALSAPCSWSRRCVWAVQRARYMTLETIALISDHPPAMAS